MWTPLDTIHWTTFLRGTNKEHIRKRKVFRNRDKKGSIKYWECCMFASVFEQWLYFVVVVAVF